MKACNPFCKSARTKSTGQSLHLYPSELARIIFHEQRTLFSGTRTAHVFGEDKTTERQLHGGAKKWARDTKTNYRHNSSAIRIPRLPSPVKLQNIPREIFPRRARVRDLSSDEDGWRTIFGAFFPSLSLSLSHRFSSFFFVDYIGRFRDSRE